MKNYIKGSGNVFRDIGCANPEEKQAKAQLAYTINKIIEQRGLTQQNAAQILGIDQPKVSALKNGKLTGFSIERLFVFLAALDHQIDIIVRDKSAQSKDKIIHVA